MVSFFLLKEKDWLGEDSHSVQNKQLNKVQLIESAETSPLSAIHTSGYYKCNVTLYASAGGYPIRYFY
jgi:hypothetical protein